MKYTIMLGMAVIICACTTEDKSNTNTQIRGTNAEQEDASKIIISQYTWFKKTSAMMNAQINEIKSLDEQKDKAFQIRSRAMKEAYGLSLINWNKRVSKFDWKPFYKYLPTDAVSVLTQDFQKYD